jgi:hypothetical protein
MLSLSTISTPTPHDDLKKYIKYPWFLDIELNNFNYIFNFDHNLTDFDLVFVLNQILI